MENNLHFVGNLANIQLTAYTNKDGQSHQRVDFELVQEIRAWKLEVTKLDTGQLFLITSIHPNNNRN